MRLLASAAPQPPLVAATPDVSPAPPPRAADDRERMAQSLSDVVVHRLFAAGLDLQSALGLIGGHPAAEELDHAIGELDQAICDIRDAVFDRLSE